MAQHPDDYGDRRSPVTEREREIIVTNGDRRGSGLGTLIAVIGGVVLVLLVAWLLFFNQAGGDGDGPTFPDEVDINVNDGGGAPEAPEGQ